MLTLNGIHFGPVFCATGARGFYGEGYPFHRFWKYAGMNWDGVGFSGKTLTLEPRVGNMPLEEDGVTPKEILPRCIWTDFRRGGEIINAVGLSNHGAYAYLMTGKYHTIEKPFFISFMALANDSSGREDELRRFCKLLLKYLPFKVAFALQLNFGCPNSGHSLSEFIGEIANMVQIAKSTLSGYQVPIVVNVNALMPTEVLVEVARTADALWIGNTIPWRGTEMIDWSQYGERSPIRRRGFDADGGLSSPLCLPFTEKKVWELRESGVTLPIIGGNGIRNTSDIQRLEEVGCNAVFIGSLALVRPMYMQMVVDKAYDVFAKGRFSHRIPSV